MFILYSFGSLLLFFSGYDPIYCSTLMISGALLDIAASIRTNRKEK